MITLSPEISRELTPDGDYQFIFYDVRRGAKATFLINAMDENAAKRQLVFMLDTLDRLVLREGDDAKQKS